jgi:hypothetical protein
VNEPAVARRCGNCRTADDLVDHPRWGWTCQACVEINAGSAHVVEGSYVPTSPLTAASPVPVPVPVPSIEEREDLDVLLAAGELKPQHVETKELPEWATASMRQVLDHLALCSGLLLAAGDDGTVIYAVDWAAKRLGLSGSTVSIALRRLRRCGAIRLVKVLPPVEQKRRAGSRVYAVGRAARTCRCWKAASVTGRSSTKRHDDLSITHNP